MLKEIFALKTSLQSVGKKGLALDIDETLSITRDSYFAALMEQIANPENLTVAELVKKYMYSWNVPYWNTAEAEALRASLIVNEDHHANVALIHGADKAIQEIGKHVEIVAYITARPDVLRVVTEAWIAKHHLPKAPVILKPDYATDNNAWKAAVLDFLYPEVNGIIDDNPGLPARLPVDYLGTIYVYENAYTEETSLDVVNCPDWESVISQVKKRHDNS